jgi:ankyrin repeat protein
MNNYFLISLGLLLVSTLQGMEENNSFEKQAIIKEFLNQSHFRNNGTFLHHAAELDDITGIQSLIYHGANINATDNDNCTPLYIAMNHRNYDTVKVLMRVELISI